MTRLYFDSNIYRYIKPIHPSFSSGLLKVMNETKDKFLFVFSDGHLDDLRNSRSELKQQDLHLMGSYVKDNFFTRDPISRKVTCKLLTPIQADAQIDHEAYKKAIDKPFDFDEIFKGLDNTPEGRLAKQVIDSVYNMPLSSLGNTMDTSILNEKSRDLFDKMFPGYTPNMTLKDFFRSIGPFTSSLMKDSFQVTELRRYIKSYIDSDNYSFHLWGMEFNQKLKEHWGKSFLEVIDGMLLEDQKGDFYLRFHHAYTMLEMYNITQEKTGGKTKKFSFQSLANDAIHAYFGSMCDSLITDDKGLQVKAAILYKLFGINTKILSSSDFLAKYDSLTFSETSSQFIDEIGHSMDSSEVLTMESDIESRNMIFHYRLEKPILNFFTMMYTVRGQKVFQIVLSLGRYWNNGMLMIREIELIVNRCIIVFGKNDDDGKGQFDLNEKIDSGSLIRSWDNRRIQLAVTKDNGNFYVDLCLYLNPAQ